MALQIVHSCLFIILFQMYGKPNTVPLLPWHIAEAEKQAKLANAFPKKLDNDGRTILKTEYREKNSTTL